MARRLVILRAAGAAFRRFGFHQAGMREIAEEAGLSPANLYYYFRGKGDLLAFCQDHALDRMLEEASRVRLLRIPSEDRLAAVIRSQVHCILDDLAGAGAHLEVDFLPPKVRGRIIAKRDRYERALRDLIRVGVREGRLETSDPALAARVILGAVNWAARWYDPSGEKTPGEIADFFVGHLVRSLRRRGDSGG